EGGLHRERAPLLPPRRTAEPDPQRDPGRGPAGRHRDAQTVRRLGAAVDGDHRHALEPVGVGSVSAIPSPQVPTTAKRRVVQLGMLTFAVLVVMAAYAGVGLGINGQVPSGMLGYGLGLGGLVFAAYLVLARFAPWADPLLLPLVTLINGIGLVMIYRIEQAGQPGANATTQLMWTALGVVMFAVTLIVLRDHRILQRFTYTAGFAGLVLLATPAILPSSLSEVQGAKIWIRIGWFSIQPGEFAKLALVVFFAGYLVAKKDVLS